MPDVCKTPDKGIPIPYQNEAYSSDLAQGTTTVFADGGNMIANLGSRFAKSVYDEGGSMGGVVSGTHKAEAEWITHSFDVFFEKNPACRLTDKMFHNHRNTVNLSGLCQENLSDEDFEKELCKLACECWNAGKQGGTAPLQDGKTHQDCLNKKIEEQCYENNEKGNLYPKSDSEVWREVPYDRGKDWDMIGSKSNPDLPTSNYIRPNSRRPDITRLGPDGKPSKIYDVKFPTDPTGNGNMGKLRQEEYEEIAKKHTGSRDNFEEFNVKERCGGCGDPALAPKPAEAKQGDDVKQLEPVVVTASRESGINGWDVAAGLALVALFATGLGEIGVLGGLIWAAAQ